MSLKTQDSMIKKDSWWLQNQCSNYYKKAKIMFYGCITKKNYLIAMNIYKF